MKTVKVKLLRHAALIGAASMVLGGCTGGRLLSLRQGDTVLFSSSIRREEITTKGVSTPYDIVSWIGNNQDFVDAFSSVPGPDGSLQAVFVRIPVNPPTGTPTARFDFNVVTLASTLPRDPLIAPPQAFRSVRHYDIGTCSAVISWRTILDQIVAELPGMFRTAEAAEDRIALVRIGGSITLTPLFRETPPDGVKVFIPLQIEFAPAGDGRVNLELVIDLNPVGSPGLAPIVASVQFRDFRGDLFVDLAEVFGGIDPDGILQRAAVAVRSAAMSALGRLVPAVPVTVRRSHVRPEGLEVVLAENTQDPQDGLLRPLGFCARPIGVQPRVGFVGAFFDPDTARPDPPLFVPPTP